MKIAMLLIVLWAHALWAGERITTEKFSDLTSVVKQKVNKYGADLVLVVYDFDNTLMMMKQDVGSDQWFSWQSEIIRSGKKNKDAVAESMSELFEIQLKLFALGRMQLVEKSIPETLTQIRALHVKEMILTSRGPDLRFDIEKELGDVGLDFSQNTLGPENGYPGTLSISSDSNRRISFMNGIAMGSGQNKGKVLEFLLTKTNAKIKSVIVIDDTLKNIENLENEFSGKLDLQTLHYLGAKERIKQFEKSNKTNAKKQWKLFKNLTDSIYRD